MTNDTQTSPSIPEEWLSAYLDGELTDDERDAVDKALAESASLQAQLNELSGVSELLKSLPQPKLGGEFASTLKLDAPVRLSAGLPWKLGMTTSALVAASLVAGVLWIQSDIRDEAPMSAVAVSESAVRESAVFDDVAVADSLKPGSGSSEQPAALSLASAPEHYAAEVAAAGSMPKPAATEPMTEESMTAEAEASVDFDPYLYYASSRPRPGELLEVLENVDGNVAVVEWVVLDVSEAMNDLEVTLAKLGVENTPGNGVRAEDSDELMAVFINGDESVVQAVMAQAQNGVLSNSYSPATFSADPVGNVAAAENIARAEQQRRMPAGRQRPMAQPYSVPKQAVADGSTGSPAKPASPAASEPPAASDRDTGVSKPVAEPPRFDRAMRSRGGTNEPKSLPESAAESQKMARDGLADAAAEPSSANDRRFRFGSPNNYQVQLQVSDESLSRIQLKNSLVPAAVPQQVLVVLKKATPPPPSSAGAGQ